MLQGAVEVVGTIVLMAAWIVAIGGTIGTVTSWRNNEPDKWKYALATIVAIVAIFALRYVLPESKHREYSNCYTDWDGRSNSTVCE